MSRTVLIIGGGASGMLAALTALEDPQNTVLLSERQSRVGRKLLSTGNGRCNLTNLHAAPGHYHGQSPDFCHFALEQFPVADTLAYFDALGLETVTEPDGKIYPRSNMANSVLDVLRYGLEHPRLRLLSGDGVADIRKKGDVFAVTFASGERHRNINKVILACGGAAGSKVGGVLDGYKLAKSLGHHRTALYPSLVQIKTDPTYPRSLKGVKTPARLALHRGSQALAENEGEILFTEYGVSGPAVFEISRYAATGGDGLILHLDLWAEKSPGEILTHLRARRDAKPGQFVTEQTAGCIFAGVLHSRLGQVVVKAAGFSPAAPLHALTDLDLAHLAETCKDFSLPVTGTCGFDQAQVTAGGLDTSEFDPHTMQSRLVPGLYACGELLDIDGDCGGYNLQWAWSSCRLAGRLL